MYHVAAVWPSIATGSLDMCRGARNQHAPAVVTGLPDRYLEMDAGAAVRELGVDFVGDLVTAEMKAGDVLLFNNILPHR